MIFTERDKAFAANLFERVRAESAAAGGGVTRPSYSPVETRAAEVIAEAADSQALHSAYDDVGNLVVTVTTGKPKRATWIGSHLDSVPQGGNYDGLAGVVAAVLILSKAKETGLAHPLVGVGLRGEESAWFGTPHIGAKALLGKLDPGVLDGHRLDGLHRTFRQHIPTLREAMSSCVPSTEFLEKISRQEPLANPDEIIAWWELHIEQGPVLEKLEAPVGIVSGIDGSVRAPGAVMRGKAAHSGTTPHDDREDAVMRFVELMDALEQRRIGLVQSGIDVKITCGRVATRPDRHAITRVADEVTFSLDVRGKDLQAVRDVYAFASMYSLGALDLGNLVTTEPCALKGETYAATGKAANRLGVTAALMQSGAGHDVSVFHAAGVPSGLLFVRNSNGSHNPDEAMEMDDFMKGVEVLWETIAGS